MFFGMRELLSVFVCCFRCSSSIVFALVVCHALHWQFMSGKEVLFCDESWRCLHFRLQFVSLLGTLRTHVHP